MSNKEHPKRISVRFAGESGQGINTLGILLSKILQESNKYVFATREYPSLIKGGNAYYQIEYSNQPITSSTKQPDILCVLSKESLIKYSDDLDINTHIFLDSKEFSEKILKRRAHTILDTQEILVKNNSPEIMSNIILFGAVVKSLGINLKISATILREYFSKKNVDIEKEINCFKEGYERSKQIFIEEKKFVNSKKKHLLSGNEMLSLGAIACGVRAYYAYPMTPATSIFKILGDTSQFTKILVKQAENEITAIQLTMGSMAMGTRALVATSGGGFDLMIESISCAGITETPLVIVLAQRAGAGTGLATHTGGADLRNAINCGHGEFPRVVMSLSDISSCYSLVQKAFNIAEKYQIPVILLSEKQIAESLYSFDMIPNDEKIERGMKDGTIRYGVDSDGVSKRWTPEFKKQPWHMNSDEHNSDGSSSDDPYNTTEMVRKRAQKLKCIRREIPEPRYYGNTRAKYIFVGWGSVKNSLLDYINEDSSIGFLHYEYMYPFKANYLRSLLQNKDKHFILVENNSTGQLGELIKTELNYEFEHKLLKYDGRAIDVDDIKIYLEEIM